MLLQRSPFCNACPAELADRFEAALSLIPDTSHLVLVNPPNPTGAYAPPRPCRNASSKGWITSRPSCRRSGTVPVNVNWCNAPPRPLGLVLDADAVDALVDAVGTDSARLESELRKLSLRSNRISGDLVHALVGGRSTNALAVGDALLEGNPGEAIALWDALIDAGEPALRIVATLTGQVRGWLWVSLMEQQGSGTWP